MQIQKGVVKYKDRNDIICTYGVLDNGTTYYFLNDSLENGYFIASLKLVEAIDPMVLSDSIGLIDNNGNIIIPFENKKIRVLSEYNSNVLLVEKANPISSNIMDAINLKNDPTKAGSLISQQAVIKEKMNALIGNGGRYLFNDMCSEATLYDINGNNLLNGEYYSFIALSSNDIYLSKNLVDSSIEKYNYQVNTSVEDVNNSFDVTDLDAVSDMGNISGVSDDENTSSNEEVVDTNSDQINEEVQDKSEVKVQNNEVVEESISDFQNTLEEKVEDTKVDDNKDVVNVLEDDKDIDDNVVEAKEDVEDEKNEIVDLTSDNSIDSFIDIDKYNVDEIVLPSFDDNKDEVKEVKENKLDEYNEEEDFFKDSYVKRDKINTSSGDSYFDIDMEDDNYNDYTDSYSVIGDAAESIKNLIDTVNNKNEIINELEDRYNKISDAYKTLRKRYEDEKYNYDDLANKYNNLENICDTYRNKINSLTSKMRFMKKELDGKDNLGKLVEEARGVVSFDNNKNNRRRVA